jgi:hypothetical protein
MDRGVIKVLKRYEPGKVVQHNCLEDDGQSRANHGAGQPAKRLVAAKKPVTTVSKAKVKRSAECTQPIESDTDPLEDHPAYNRKKQITQPKKIVCCTGD